MFKYIHKFWLQKKRKEEFINKLKDPNYGKEKIQFRNQTNLVIGSLMIIFDHQTDTITTLVYTGVNDWVKYNNSNVSSIKRMTNNDVENFITTLRNQAKEKDKILIYDSAEYLNFDYKKSKTFNTGGLLSPNGYYDITRCDIIDV